LARISAGFGFDRYCRRAHPWAGGRLDLQRLEQLQRAPELGQRAAAVTQQGVERPAAVAVADQREAEIRVALDGEQLGLDPLGALEPPGGAGDATGEHALQGAIGGQLLDQRRLERAEFLRMLVADDHEFPGAKTMLEGVLRRSGLAFRRPGSARLRAVATTGLGARAGRPKPGITDSFAGRGVRRRQPTARYVSLAENRNFIQRNCQSHARPRLRAEAAASGSRRKRSRKRPDDQALRRRGAPRQPQSISLPDRDPNGSPHAPMVAATDHVRS
jgi:hypothetical protein